MAIGRISGQMLKANLQRSGVDLAFETNLLVLDVTNSFVGIGTSTPSRQLHISGTGAIRLPSGTSDQRGTAANGDIRYNSELNIIEGYSNGAWDDLTEGGIDNVVEDTTPQLGGNLDINGFNITSARSNEDINIIPSGTGSVAITKVDINGGAIDGTTIGANSAAAGTFTNLTANGAINTDGITIEDNNITATRSNDNLVLSGSGTGSVVVNGTTSFNGNVFFGDNNIGDVGNINVDSIGADNGAYFYINLGDNQASAFEIKEDSTSYLSFVTTNGAEQITLGKKLAAGSVEVTGSNFTITGGTINGTTIGATTKARVTLPQLTPTIIS